jgi:DeoR/GlpR family transcriptional regulator of sugar metabolism
MARSNSRLSQDERQARLLALLRREGTVRIATLARTFAVTTETVRRDLDQLAQSGALKRTYGGGAARSLTDEPGIGVRAQTHAAERARIGAAAAARVIEGDALMIDAGSTTALFANALAARDLPLTIVTNCLPVARALATASRCRVVLCPGEFVLRESGVYGPDTVEFLRRFKVNLAVIGAGGLAIEGVSDADSRSVAVKRAMLDCAERAMLLVDSSKFDVLQFERVAPLAEIDEVVVERAPPPKLAAALRAAKIELVVAKG